jgi:hypothetical protein
VTKRPFKKFYCDRPDVFLIPPSALKIWLFHYTREGKDRRSWPSVETLMKKCGIAKDDTVYKWRAWLQENGWLKKVGEIPPKHNTGEFAVPIFRVTRGTVPQQTGDGDHTPLNGGRSHPIKRGTGAPLFMGAEVDSVKQVEPQRQVKAERAEPVSVSEPVSEPVRDESTDTPKRNRETIGQPYPHLKPTIVNGHSYFLVPGSKEKPKGDLWVFDPVYQRYHSADDIGGGLFVPSDNRWLNRCPNCPEEPCWYAVNEKHELIQRPICFNCTPMGEL